MHKTLTTILIKYTFSFSLTMGYFQMKKECKPESYGCKNQLLINKMILENSHSHNTNLSIAWIDYKKVFDSVPHSWIKKCLEKFKISPVICNFLSHCMNIWKTILVLNTGENILNAGDISIKNDMFQGNSFSPILFCVALIPLSKLLNNTAYGYRIYDNTLNHLF